jgi:hypothetical protein
MTLRDDSTFRFVLAGYLKHLDHGFAIPCFVSGNTWYLANCSPRGDHGGVISSFEPFDSDEMIHLPVDMCRPVGVGDRWVDVFLWREAVHVGTAAELWGKLDRQRGAIEQEAPLSLLDLGTAVQTIDCRPLARRVFTALRTRFGEQKATHWRNETYLRGRLIKRLCGILGPSAESNPIKTKLQLINVKSLLDDTIVVEMPNSLFADLEASSLIVALRAHVKQDASAFGTRDAIIVPGNAHNQAEWPATNFPRQLELFLPHAESYAREDFVRGKPNASAVAVVERWPDWPGHAVILVGPEGAGKSHLAAIWAELSGARRISARALGGTNLLGTLATGALVVEDAPAQLDERALFHLLNLMREEEAFLLITSRTEPVSWNVALPDLMSRLRAIPTFALGPPDDALLRALLIKLFADRQLAVDEILIGYLATRIERSFAAARSVVETLDREALRLKRPVTRALAAQMLSRPGRGLDGTEQGLLL